MKVQVYRTNSSSYQDGNFFREEKAALESIPGVSYIQSLSEFSKDSPFVLISNTHTVPSELPSELLDETVLWIHPNSGYDNFSKRFVEKSKFPIILGNPVRAAAVTEYILGCVFKHFTSVPNHAYWSEDRKWKPLSFKRPKGSYLWHGSYRKNSLSSAAAFVPRPHGRRSLSGRLRI